ncbi:MAG: phosphoglycerate kinase, partial [Chloroflexi bacterium]|nr:phosphoglycerate kinase [Chloroflexota bacterium]
MPEKATVRDYPVEGKRVLVRVDFNVPFEPGTNRVSDDSRIRAALPTIAYLRERGARVILASHLGRPKGTDDSLRMTPVANLLAEILGAEVSVAPDSVGAETESVVARLAPGEILLLENLRFHSEEERNDPAFAQGLARLADVFVNDAFGTAHRAHASTEGVAHHLPAVAGLLMEAELRMLGMVLKSPPKPLALLMGGAKVGDKLAVMRNLVPHADLVLVGGGMAAAFLAARGLEVGASLTEPGGPEIALA